MRKLIVISIIFGIIFISSSITIAKNIEVGITHFPPFYETEANNITRGAWKDLIENILTISEIKYDIVNYPPIRLYKNLAEGTVHVWMGTKNVPEYEGKVISSNLVVQKISVNIYGKNRELIPSGNYINTLKGKRVILIHGFVYGGLLEEIRGAKDIIFIDCPKKHEQAFRMLEANRGDFLIDYEDPCNETQKRFGYKFPSKHIGNVDILFHVSKLYSDPENKDYPNPESLLKKIDEGFFKYKKKKGE